MSQRVLGTVVLLWCLAVGHLFPATAAASPNDLLTGRSAVDATYLAMQAIPDLVYAGQPDSLLDWLNAWGSESGAVEPLVRVRIMGAIWDGRFTEELYGPGIINQLVDFCTGSWRQGQAPILSADLAAAVAAGTAPSYDAVREAFETFSQAFADQLLPHVPMGSPEEFFCLMYSGRSTQAWRLLASGDLAGTHLEDYRDRKLQVLHAVLPKFIAVQGGMWSPFGKYAFAGDHALVGLQFGVRKGPWFARLVTEVRLGRTNLGYVARNENILGVSDRFDAALVSMELGRAVPVWGSLSLEGFGGVGMDAVKPLKDEDLVLDALHLDLGGGLHYDLGAHDLWFLALTGRREWTRPRNSEGTPLWGDAWSVRLALGMNIGQPEEEVRRLLQP